MLSFLAVFLVVCVLVGYFVAISRNLRVRITAVRYWLGLTASGLWINGRIGCAIKIVVIPYTVRYYVLRSTRKRIICSFFHISRIDTLWGISFAPFSCIPSVFGYVMILVIVMGMCWTAGCVLKYWAVVLAGLCEWHVWLHGVFWVQAPPSRFLSADETVCISRQCRTVCWRGPSKETGAQQFPLFDIDGEVHVLSRMALVQYDVVLYMYGTCRTHHTLCTYLEENFHSVNFSTILRFQGLLKMRIAFC